MRRDTGGRIKYGVRKEYSTAGSIRIGYERLLVENYYYEKSIQNLILVEFNKQPVSCNTIMYIKDSEVLSVQLACL